MKDELPNGFGKAFFVRGPYEGVSYYGEFVDGRFEGSGYYQHPKIGYQYRGHFHCNKFSGLGIWSCAEEESKEDDTATGNSSEAPLNLSKQHVGEWSEHMLKLCSPSCSVENSSASLLMSHRYYGHHNIEDSLRYDFETYPSARATVSYSPKELFGLLDTLPHGVDFDPEDEKWAVQKLYLHMKSTAAAYPTDINLTEKPHDCLILHRPDMNMIIADTIQEYLTTQPVFLPTTAPPAQSMKSTVITAQSIEEFMNLLGQTRYVLVILSSLAVERYKDPLLSHHNDPFLLQLEASLRVAVRTKRLNAANPATAVCPFIIPVLVGDYIEIERHGRMFNKFRINPFEYAKTIVMNSSQRAAYLARQAAETAEVRASEAAGSLHISPNVHHSPGYSGGNLRASNNTESSRLRYENGSSYQGELDSYNSRQGYGVYMASEEKGSIDWTAGSIYTGRNKTVKIVFS